MAKVLFKIVVSRRMMFAELRNSSSVAMASRGKKSNIHTHYLIRELPLEIVAIIAVKLQLEDYNPFMRVSTFCRGRIRSK